MPQRILKVFVPIVLIAAVLGSAAFYLQLSQPSAEAAIVQAILNAEEDAAIGSVTGVARALSNDYADAAGHTKRDITRMAAAGLRWQQWQFSVEVKALDVAGDAATSLLRIGMWPYGDMSMELDYTVTLRWRREGRAWRVVGSEGWQGQLESAAIDAMQQHNPDATR